jgi:hypothetical protein
VPDETVLEVLSTADLGLCPDPKNPLNDVSTMNKTLEYMAMELPVLAFDLIETRVSAGDAAVYVADNDAVAYARALVDLLDDDARRADMAARGRERIEQELGWPHQRTAYVEVFERLTGRFRSTPMDDPAHTATEGAALATGQPLVIDLRDSTLAAAEASRPEADPATSMHKVDGRNGDMSG